MNEQPTNNEQPELHRPAADVGTLLAALRREAGLTQEQLASEMHVSRPMIGNAERGSPSGPLLKNYIERFPGAAADITRLAPTSRDTTYANEDIDTMILSRASKNVDINGIWWALWESTADGEQIINSEQLDIRMRRNGALEIRNESPSEENPKGGYLWLASCRVFDGKYIMGTYIAREPNVRSKGTLYMVLHNSGRFVEGQWVGCNYDGDWARGLVVFCRDRSALPELLGKHRNKLPPMPYNQGESHDRAG